MSTHHVGPYRIKLFDREKFVRTSTNAGKSELLLSSLHPKLREIIDNNTSWYEGRAGRIRKFTLNNIVIISEQWRKAVL